VKLIHGDANVLLLIIALLERGYYIPVSTFMKWCSGGNSRLYSFLLHGYYGGIPRFLHGYDMFNDTYMQWRSSWKVYVFCLDCCQSGMPGHSAHESLQFS